MTVPSDRAAELDFKTWLELLRENDAGWLASIRERVFQAWRLLFIAKCASPGALVEALQRAPESIFLLTPRQLEELVAELLSDQGWDIQLTPSTRDGGVDILAYLDIGVGRVLCLVQVKRYRSGRSVGINFVRELYGALADHDASQAMLVTTSSFSRHAQGFARRHAHRVSLQDHHALMLWIQKYRRHEPRH